MTAPYRSKHIATDPLHVTDEPRYVVTDLAGTVVSTHHWAYEAETEARRLSIADGACSVCGGDGSVIADWTGSPDGDMPISAVCPHCGGSGREP